MINLTSLCFKLSVFGKKWQKPHAAKDPWHRNLSVNYSIKPGNIPFAVITVPTEPTKALFDVRPKKLRIE